MSFSAAQLYTPMGTPKTGEVQGGTTALQLPDVPCRWLRIKAASDNAGLVYIGDNVSVTKATGSTNATAGWPLSPDGDTGWVPASNLNLFFRICDNTGDDLFYWTMK